MPNGGLVDANGVPKPAATRLAELRDAIHTGVAPPRLGVFKDLGKQVGGAAQATTR